VGHEDRKQSFYFIKWFAVSTYQQEINVCGMAFRYQLSKVWPLSINLPSLILKRADLQKLKMELFKKRNS
jgi:hypothetical protein